MLVGEVSKNPETVARVSVKAVLVPAQVKLEVEKRWLLVGIELVPKVRVEFALS